MTDERDEIPNNPDARTAWVIAATGDDGEVKRRYNLWAKYYDSDLVDNDGYLAPAQSVKFCESYIDKNAKILDAACGTGLSGKAFCEAGYKNLIGLDFAADMLEIARKTDYYQNLLEADLGKILPYETHSFDAVIKIGGTPVPPICMHEFARITRPEGYIFYCGSVKGFHERGFGMIATSYVDRSIWRALPRSEPFHPLPISTPDLVYEVIGFQSLR